MTSAPLKRYPRSRPRWTKPARVLKTSRSACSAARVKSHRAAAKSDQANPTSSGHADRGQPGHGRVRSTHLPAVVEVVDVPEIDKCCACCGLPLAPLPGTQASEVIEIEVKAYRRIIQRKRYQPTCLCCALPSIVTAPVPPKIIPKGKYGISVWTELIVDKFLYARPTHRLLQSWQALGLPVAQGTVTGGFAYLAPLFVLLVQAFRDRQHSDTHWHADETGWKVFEHVEGKKTNRWYLWGYQSRSVMYFDLEPSRAATVPTAHFKGLSEGIVICDRYGAYKKMARTLGLLLAFCWAHVRRDFLTLAQGYPQLEAWAPAWVELIGTLYHLNDARLKMRGDAAAFARRTATVEQHLQGMLASSAQFAASMFTVLLTLDQVWDINARVWMAEFLQACAVGRGAPPALSLFLPWAMTPERLAHFGGKPPGTRAANMTQPNTS